MPTGNSINNFLRSALLLKDPTVIPSRLSRSIISLISTETGIHSSVSEDLYILREGFILTITTTLSPSITLQEARQLIAAAEMKAQEINQPMNIAVVDAGGNLVAHARMDKAWIGSIDISINKAWTARAFDRETKELAKISQSGDQAFGIHSSNQGRVMVFPGGIPLKRGDQVVGAIGVSGGLVKQDQTVAEAGAAAFS